MSARVCIAGSDSVPEAANPGAGEDLHPTTAIGVGEVQPSLAG